jgi:hypothetical protein
MSEKSNKTEVSKRVAEARALLNQNWLIECSRLLDAAGVPEWTCLEGESVPSNTVPSRLKWFMLRRKDVQCWELDGWDKELKLAMEHAKSLEMY